MNDVLVDFFSRTTENRLNTYILYNREYYDEVRDYVDQLIDIPLDLFVYYIYTSYSRNSITSKDVIQFSSFYNSTKGVCYRIKEKDNPGMRFTEIGRLLLDDGKERNNWAYTKYGENHAKTAGSLGLLFEFYNTYYLSCFGDIFLGLNENESDRFLNRLIIRCNLISRMIQASKNGRVNMREFLYMISDSTYTRRKSNIKQLINHLNKSEEYNFDEFISRINL